MRTAGTIRVNRKGNVIRSHGLGMVNAHNLRIVRLSLGSVTGTAGASPRSVEECWSQQTLSRSERTEGATTFGVRSRNSSGNSKEYYTENYTAEYSIISNLISLSILSKKNREILIYPKRSAKSTALKYGFIKLIFRHRLLGRQSKRAKILQQ
jgi:hypothetical protein